MRLASQLSDRLDSPTRSALLGYATVAAIAAAADLGTKQLAVSALGDDRVIPLAGRLSMMVVFNTGSAGGVMIGPYTWHFNVIVTLVALCLITSVASSLIAIDRRATLALGMVAGGAVGNLASMLVGPVGVADFLAYKLPGDTTIVMNVADLALWCGALLLLPVVRTLVQAIRTERRATRTAMVEA